MTSMSEFIRSVFDHPPRQGSWSEAEYLRVTDYTSRRVEFTDGYLEPLPWVTDWHQSITQFFLLALNMALIPLGGTVHFSGIRLRIRPGKFREPDLLLVKSATDPRRRNRFWKGADLTLEVVSKDKPERDLIDKVHDYAEGNVPEYWIVNPFNETITVLRLENGSYVEHGVFRRGDRAASVILSGFGVDVAEVFDLECPPDDEEGE